MYTWNCSALDVDNHSKTEPGCGCFQLPSGPGNGSVRGGGSSRKRKQLRETELSFHKQVSSEKALKHNTRGSAKAETKHQAFALQHQAFALDDDIIPPPPTLELKSGSEIELSDIQKNFQRLYDYNVMLREKFVATQSLLHDLAAKSPSPTTERQT